MSCKHLLIKNFKCLKSEEIHFKGLNILTGTHSSGKSSIIQGIKIVTNSCDPEEKQRLTDFKTIRNKHLSRSENIEIKLDDFFLHISENEINHSIQEVDKHHHFWFLSENRIGVESIASRSHYQNNIGEKGEYIFDIYDKKKTKQLPREKIRDDSHLTLQGQVDFWLKYITGQELYLQTEEINSSKLKVSFKDALIGDLDPFLIGSGMSYICKIVILALIAPVNHTILIENPDIYLHPKAQAKLGEFLAFVVNGGVQVILETHSVNIIDKIRYEVYKKNIDKDNVRIFYKEDSQTSFLKFSISDRGRYIDTVSHKEAEFPIGFFDATLDELLEVG